MKVRNYYRDIFIIVKNESMLSANIDKCQFVFVYSLRICMWIDLARRDVVFYMSQYSSYEDYNRVRRRRISGYRR